MPYIGNRADSNFSSIDMQTLTGNGGTSYTLNKSVTNQFEIEVYVNNVRQEPGVAYTASGTSLNMTGNVIASDGFYVIYQGKAVQTKRPPDGSVTDSSIVNMSASKLTGALPAISGANLTNLSSSELTGALPALDGSALTGISGGKVLQVVHTLYDTEESIVGQANTVKPTGLIGTITPTSSTSNILIMYGITMGTSASGSAMGGQHHTVYHDIGQTGSYTALTSRYFGSRPGGDGRYTMLTAGGNLLHDHNTTSAINYNVQFHYTSNWDKTMYINRGGSVSPTDAIDGQSYMTLMEIE